MKKITIFLALLATLLITSCVPIPAQCYKAVFASELTSDSSIVDEERSYPDTYVIISPSDYYLQIYQKNSEGLNLRLNINDSHALIGQLNDGESVLGHSGFKEYRCLKAYDKDGKDYFLWYAFNYRLNSVLIFLEIRKGVFLQILAEEILSDNIV